jgi:hypothetical protein
MATKYIKWPKNRPNDYKLYQHCPLQEPRKFTQIGIFGLKIHHLATLVRNAFDDGIKVDQRTALN